MVDEGEVYLFTECAKSHGPCLPVLGPVTISIQPGTEDNGITIHSIMCKLVMAL